MNRWTLPVLLVAFLTAPLASATHEDGGCPLQSADPSTYTAVDLTPVGGSLYYVEERDNPFGTSPPVPLSGFLFGGGTWVYEETNGIPGLQRGAFGFGACQPEALIEHETGMDVPSELFCLIIDEDPIQDDNCGHGGDTIIF